METNGRIIQLKQLIRNDFLELVTIKQKEVLRLKPPIILKFEPNVIQKILCIQGVRS